MDCNPIRDALRAVITPRAYRAQTLLTSLLVTIFLAGAGVIAIFAPCFILGPRQSIPVKRCFPSDALGRANRTSEAASGRGASKEPDRSPGAPVVADGATPACCRTCEPEQASALPRAGESRAAAAGAVSALQCVCTRLVRAEEEIGRLKVAMLKLHAEHSAMRETLCKLQAPTPSLPSSGGGAASDAETDFGIPPFTYRSAVEDSQLPRRRRAGSPPPATRAERMERAHRRAIQRMSAVREAIKSSPPR
mmetsp:Transcript_35709/g.76233  ORF Transcript_35709/g.76233 Transcript_35709/m.76233 type:complete len:250 (-) Transcript_35709:337-1086(-)